MLLLYNLLKLPYSLAAQTAFFFDIGTGKKGSKKTSFTLAKVNPYDSITNGIVGFNYYPARMRKGVKKFFFFFFTSDNQWS